MLMMRVILSVPKRLVAIRVTDTEPGGGFRVTCVAVEVKPPGSSQRILSAKVASDRTCNWMGLHPEVSQSNEAKGGMESTRT